jgi:hypothetical protein
MEGSGLEGIGLKKDCNAEVKGLIVYVMSLYKPMMM